jgi:flagellin
MSANAPIALTMGMRNSLYALSNLEDQITVVNKRLATGKKVNSALDNPLNYFLAQGFDRDKRDLANLLDVQNIGLQTLQKVVKTTESISKLMESVQALARQARQSNDVAARNTLGTQMATLLNQISELTRDAGFNGKNLLKETPDNLTIPFNAVPPSDPNYTQIAIAGLDMTAYGALLSFGDGVALGSGDGFTLTAQAPPLNDLITYTAGTYAVTATGDDLLDRLINNTAAALERIEAAASTFSVNLTVLQIRIDYSKDWQRRLAETGDMLTIADMNEEGANLTSLQTRQQLAVTALSLANRSDQSVLRLFQ